jgi:multidrug efflux pump subunit AcrA (membrane-fusion protein)
VPQSFDEFAELRAVIDQEVARLPAKYRSIVVLADLEGRDRKTVAAELGIAEGTVASRHSRARALLAGRLRLRGWGPQAYLAVVTPAVVGPALANQSLTLMNSGRTAGTTLTPAELLAREVTSTMTRTKLTLAAAGVAAVLIAAGVSADGPKSAEPPGYTLHSAGGSTVLLNPATGDTWVLQQPPRGEPAWVPVRRPAPPAAPVPPSITPPAKSESVAKDEPPPTKTEPEPVLANGRLVLANQVRVRPRSTGVVSRAMVRQGDEVKQGQTLVELDDTDAKLALERAEAGLMVAQAGLYPDNETVTVRDRRKADAEVRRAKVEVLLAQTAVQAARLGSPVAGTAIEVNAVAGDTAGPTGPPAVVVANLRALEASADVTEAAAGRVKVGQLCLVRVAADGAEYPGMVVRVGNVVDPATGMMVVHVRLKLPDGAKPPLAGAFVTVRFGGPK